MARRTVTLKMKSRRTVELPMKERRTVTGNFPRIPQQTNVVVLVMDDVGCDQLEAYDASNEWATAYGYPVTTWIDALAARGKVYDYAYAAPICSPSRAQILTGRYPHINADHDGTGIGTLVQSGATTKLLASHYPLAKVIEGAGSIIGKQAFGKWHLGAGQEDPESPIEQAGFDGYKGSLTNPAVQNLEDPPFDAGGDYTNYWKTEADSDGYTQTYSTGIFMGTDEFNDIEEWLATRYEPFFLYWAFHSAHSSGSRDDGESEIIEEIADDAGPDGAGFPMTTTFDEAAQTASQASAHIPWRRTHAHIEAIDYLCDKLDNAIPAALRSGTIFILVGDNGTSTYVMEPETDNYFLNGTEPPAGYDTTHFKATTYEQGVRVPLIIGGDPFPANGKGTHSTSLVDLVDIYPTVLDLLSIGWQSYLTSEGALDQVDGKSLVGTFAGGGSGRTHTLSQTFTPNGANYGLEETSKYGVTNAHRWKLKVLSGSEETHTEELYYLGDGEGHGYPADPTEQTNRISKITPGSGFDQNVWMEYDDLARWALTELLGQSAGGGVPNTLFSMAPPYTALNISPTKAVQGTVAWTVSHDSQHSARLVTLANGGAQVYETSIAPNPPLDYYARGITSATGATIFTDTWVVDGSSAKNWRLGSSKDGDVGVVMTAETTSSVLHYTVRVYDSGSTTANWTWVSPAAYPATIWGCDVTDDGSEVIVWYPNASNREEVVKFAVGSGVPTSHVELTTSIQLYSARPSGDGSIMVGWSFYRRPFVWNSTTGSIIYQVNGGFGSSEVAVDSAGTVMAQGVFGTLAVWEKSGTWASSFNYVFGTSGLNIQQVVVSSDGSTIFAKIRNTSTGTTFYEIAAIDVATQALGFRRTIPFKVSPDNLVIKLSCSDDGNELVVLLNGNDNTEYTLLLYRYRTGTWQASINLYELAGEPRDGDISPDGTQYVALYSELWAGWPTVGAIQLINLPA